MGLLFSVPDTCLYKSCLDSTWPLVNSFGRKLRYMDYVAKRLVFTLVDLPWYPRTGREVSQFPTINLSKILSCFKHIVRCLRSAFRVSELLFSRNDREFS